MVLEGVPEEEQPHIREIALAWARDKAQGDEEFLLAFKEDPDHFRIIRSCSRQDEEKLFKVETAEPGASPNGGPATEVGNPGAIEGPPSVSCTLAQKLTLAGHAGFA